MMETRSITKQHRFKEGSSTLPRREVEIVQPSLAQLTIWHITLQIEADALKFPVGEL
jgi:hypothetical protein